ncbi:MAG TPA: helix-turn-helix transcriptional regulator [Gemmatimonadales bacterium]|nr:helix-turn-helix transcriptional regulator [Gemmatimonadales bacterium]
MGEPHRSRPAWSALVYFWDGGWIGVGRGGGVVPPHSHHAVQISIGLDGPIRFRHEEGPWREYQAAAVLPDEPHAFDGAGTLIAMIFIEPESREGRWLRDSLREPVAAVSTDRLADLLPALREFQDRRPGPEPAARLIGGVVHALCAGPPPLRPMDGRIVRALEVIRSRDVRGLRLEDVAKVVFLSPSRFAHLFSDEVGLPFRRYLLWRKLSRAMEEFARGSNLSQSAHAAGFSDSAHLTRTWIQMFGMPPTVMLGKAVFYEIPAPFELHPN